MILRLVMATAIALAGAGAGAGASAVAAGALSEVVMCGDDGIQTIQVDASGNPVERKPKCGDCPECNAVAMALPPRAPAQGAARRRLPGQALRRRDVFPNGRRARRPVARGPPPAHRQDFREAFR